MIRADSILPYRGSAESYPFHAPEGTDSHLPFIVDGHPSSLEYQENNSGAFRPGDLYILCVDGDLERLALVDLQTYTDLLPLPQLSDQGAGRDNSDWTPFIKSIGSFQIHGFFKIGIAA